MSIYLYVYKKMFIYNTIKQKHNFDVNNSDTIYINLHTLDVLFIMCQNRTYILQVRVINVFQTNQKQKQKI